MIGRTISHYEIVAEIGGGGMGQVYQARDTRLEVLRALKFIHPHLVSDGEFKARFLREAQTASALDHPNICSIHEVDETENGRPFICMSYYEGQTLADRLRAGPLPIEEILPIAFAIGQGLACAHRQGIFHRDIKPDNVLITHDGFVKILDFGLAKLAGGLDLTAPATNLGTARYMAPEQIDGSGADARSDVWSLGVVLYQMATGRVPFDGDHDPAVLYSILHEEPTPLAGAGAKLPESFVRVIESCLIKDPERRCASVEVLLGGLAETAAEIGQESMLGSFTAGALNSGPGVARVRRRHRARWLSAAAAVAALALAATWWFSRTPGVYSTELRVAVMPFENVAHPELNPVAEGLTTVLSEILDEAAPAHESMWVVPDRIVRYAELGNAAAAEKAFGVNRIVTGNLQRHAEGHLLQIVLRDAATTERVAEASIIFDTGNPQALVDSLPLVAAQLVGADAAPDAVAGSLYPADAGYLLPYLSGLGWAVTGDPDAALRSLRPLATDHPRFACGVEMLGWASWLAYRRDGRPAQRDSAVTLLRQAASIRPTPWRVLYHQGEVFRLLGRYEEAQAVFETACALHPGTPQLADRRARVLRATGRNSEAETLLQDVASLRPDYFEVHRLLANHYGAVAGEQEAALSSLLRSAALAPDDHFTHQLLGALYDHQGDKASAHYHLERAFQLNSNFENISNVGKVCYDQGKYEDAVRYYELAIEEEEGQADFETWGNLAINLYWAQGRRPESIERFDGAIELLEPVLRDSPGDTDLVSHLIEYHAMAGYEERTRALIRQYEHRAAEDPYLLYRIGDAYELLGDRNSALRYLGDALRRGFPLEEILATKELEELCHDPVFAQLTRTLSAPSPDPAKE